MVLIAVLLASSASTRAQTTTLIATGDTYLKSGSAHQNQGSESILRVQSSGQNRTLVRFSHAEIEAAVGSGTLVSATLQLHIHGNGNNWGSTGRPVNAHRLSADWTALAATWSCGIDTNLANSQADCSPQWNGGSFVSTATATVNHTNGLGGWVQYNVTADVAAFLSGTPDFGWIIKKEDESGSGQVDYTSLQGASGEAPRLIIVAESPMIDEVPPTLRFTQPSFPSIVNNQTPAIALEYADGGSGIDLATFRLLIDGNDVSSGCTKTAAGATCASGVLAAGSHTLTGLVSDVAGNQASTVYELEILLGTNVTVSLPVRWDTYLKSGSANQNQGTEAILRVQESGSNRVLVVVDDADLLAALADEPLFSATLELNIADNGDNWGTTGRPVDIHRVIDEWNELEATWNCGEDADLTNSQPDCTTWNGGSYVATPTDTVVHTKGQRGWVQYDVTQDIHAFRDGETNFGWLIKKTDESGQGRVEYQSKDVLPTATQPRLVLVLGPGGLDLSPPALRITQPNTPLLAGSPAAITLTYQDIASGVNTGTLQVLLDGADITAGCTIAGSTAGCAPPEPLGPGMHGITAHVSDTAGNAATAAFGFEVLPPGAAVTILYPTADTFLRRGAKNRNENDETYLRVKASGWNRALVRFSSAEIAALGPAAVPSAILELYIEKNRNNWGPTGRTVDLHRLTADWDEDGATWNCAADSNTANQQPDCSPQWNGGTFDAAIIDTVLHTKGLTGWVQFDVTDEVNAIIAGAPNRGWVVKKTDERKAGFVLYASREGIAGQHPRLVVGVQGPTPTASITRTVAPTPTVGGAPTHTVTQVPTDTFTPIPSNTPTNTPAPSETPTPTRTHTRTPTQTPTSTSTPIPLGVIVGEVYDDSTAQPLSDVSVVVVGHPEVHASVLSNANGRYVLSDLEVGTYTLSFSRDGYTRSLQQLTVETGRAVRVRDARLTPLAVPMLVGSAGGTLSADVHVPGNGGAAGTDGVVQLEIGAGLLASAGEVRLTALGPQGTIAPVPLGWSVLLGFAIDPALTPNGSAPLNLGVPAGLLAAGSSLPPTIAVWDEGTRTWLGGPDPSAVGGNVAIALGEFGSPINQVAVLVGDAEPAAPPEAVLGQALEGVLAGEAPGQSATVLADPPVIIAGTNGRAHVLTRLQSLDPLPSGTLIEASLKETYDLVSGGQITGLQNRQDFAAYQHSPSASGTLPSSGAIGAYFLLEPSRSFAFGELSAGRVRIDIGLPQAGNTDDVIDAPGGDVTGPGGVQVSVPPGAASGPAVITVDPVAPGSLPSGGGSHPSFIGGIDFEVTGAPLDPHAPYVIDLGTPLSTGQRVVIGVVGPSDLGTGLILTAFGYEDDGRIVVDACPASLSFCLDGFGSSGTYAVFAVPDGAAIATGIVTENGAPRSSIGVHSDATPIVSVTDGAGRYGLPAPANVSSTLTATDHVHDLRGSTTVTPSLGEQIVTADIELVASAPIVVQIDPPNHASNVAVGATISVTFSEAIAAATLSDASVQLFARQLDANDSPTGSEQPAAVRRSLSSDGKVLTITPGTALAANALYRLALASSITDRQGNALAAFASDFTTAAQFTAESLPPNTLRVSLPDANGKVFVCGGPQLALPGTLVDVINDASSLTVTTTATDASGVSGSAVCDGLFAGRCNTSQPGSFCAVLDGAIGDQILVQVEDVFGNTVMLDAGNMRDERTGAEAIPPSGGVVTFPDDQRYQAFVPDGAFTVTTVVQITPITDGGVGLDLADYPVLTSLDQSRVELVGGVKLDFEGEARRNLDVSVPAPADASTEDQYIATRVVNFRGFDEQSMADTAFFDEGGCLLHPSHCVVVTDPGIFPGLVIGGILGIHRVSECLAYLVGWVSLGEHFNDGYLPGEAGGQLLPLPIQKTEPTRVALPVPCNREVTLTLKSFAGEPIDQGGCGPGVTLTQGQVCEAKDHFTDDTTPPAVQSTFAPNGASDVSPLSPLSVTFTESLAPDSVTAQSCELATDTGPVSGHCKLVDGQNNRVLAFIPDVRLRYGKTYTWRIDGISDENQQPFPGQYITTFTTFTPKVVQHIDGDIRDVVWVKPDNLGRPHCDDLVAVAEGYDNPAEQSGDFLRGIQVYDVTDLDAPASIGGVATSGVDRALYFIDRNPSDPLLTTTGVNGDDYEGPFLVSIDGPGGHDRFGVWRMFDLAPLSGESSAPITRIASRLINHSADTWAIFNSQDPLGAPAPDFLKFVPNEQGVALELAGFGTQASYVANTPHIGLQLILPQGMNADFPPTSAQVHGTLTGVYRAVSTVRNRVLAVRQDGGQHQLVVAAANFSGIVATHTLPASSPPLGVTGLTDWDSALDFGKDEKQKRDLALVMCEDKGFCVFPVNADGKFDETLLDKGIGRIKTPGGKVRGIFGDPVTQLALVADGTAGLSIVDLIVPGGSRDQDGDNVDDRVLGTVSLGGARAQRVTVFEDGIGRRIAAVATGEGGLKFIALSPPADSWE